MSAIVLSTFNARYAHSALALRYLYANLKELQTQARIMEFTINAALQSVAEQLLTCKPRMIGLSVYIWNVALIAKLIHVPKKVSPQTLIILGGPEAAHTPRRYIDVEASRGCPFLCAFYLSFIDEKLRRFDLAKLLEALDADLGPLKGRARVRLQGALADRSAQAPSHAKHKRQKRRR